MTLSFAEAELVALVKCSSELLCVRNMLRDFGVEIERVLYADSSVALAIAKRKGAGKLRHINISCLWIQEVQGTKQLELRKVLGTETPADMMTKHVNKELIEKYLKELRLESKEGRPESAPGRPTWR